MTSIGKALSIMLREALDADYHQSTWFKDNDPGGSFVPSLDQLSAEQASEPPACGRNTVAAHAGHISFHLQAIVDFLRSGEWRESLDWESSWRRQQVSAEEWAELRMLLRSQAAEIHDHLARLPYDADEDTLTGAAALVAHCAYHLGAIRQIAAPHLQHVD